MPKRKDRAGSKRSLPMKTSGQTAPVPQKMSHSEVLATMHCSLTAPYQYIKNDKLYGSIIEGTLELYNELQPKGALESILSSLIIRCKQRLPFSSRTCFA